MDEAPPVADAEVVAEHAKLAANDHQIDWSAGIATGTKWKNFEQIQFAQQSFWRCLTCFEKEKEQKTKKSHLQVQKRGSGKQIFDYGNLMNHNAAKHQASSQASSTATSSASQKTQCDAVVKDQTLRYVAGTNAAFQVVDTAAFKEFISFVRNSTSEQFSVLETLSSSALRASANAVTAAHRETLLEELTGTPVSILIDLGTIGTRTARRHEAFFFLASKDFVHFWCNLLMEGNEDLGIDDSEWSLLVSNKLKDICAELREKGVFVVQVLGDNASPMQAAARLARDGGFDWLLCGRCVVHSFMLIFNFLLDYRPFSDLANFLSEVREKMTLPRVTEIKWMSLIYCCDYIFHEDRLGTLHYHFGDQRVNQMKRVYEWLLPFRANINILQSDDEATPISALKAIANLIQAIHEAPGHGIVVPHDALLAELGRRFETNFQSDAITMVLGLQPALQISTLPADIRQSITNAIIFKGSELLFEMKKGSIPKATLRDWLRRDLGKHVRGELPSQQKDFVSHWSLVSSDAPWLSTLALLVCQISVSEAAVERGFAAAGAILSEHRTRLGEHRLEDLLFLRFKPWEIKRPQFPSNEGLTEEQCTQIMSLITKRKISNSKSVSQSLRKGDQILVVFLNKKKEREGHIAKIQRKVPGQASKYNVTWLSTNDVGIWDAEEDYDWTKVSTEKRAREDEDESDESD
jgi:hypothetical protein